METVGLIIGFSVAAFVVGYMVVLLIATIIEDIRITASDWSERKRFRDMEKRRNSGSGIRSWNLSFGDFWAYDREVRSLDLAAFKLQEAIENSVKDSLLRDGAIRQVESAKDFAIRSLFCNRQDCLQPRSQWAWQRFLDCLDDGYEEHSEEILPRHSPKLRRAKHVRRTNREFEK